MNDEWNDEDGKKKESQSTKLQLTVYKLQQWKVFEMQNSYPHGFPCGFTFRVLIAEIEFFDAGRTALRHRPVSEKHHNSFRDLARLSTETRFNVNEVESLYELFKQRSRLFKQRSSSIIDDGLIHKEELQLALFKTPCDENLFLDRVFDLFDEKRNSVIEFEEFVHTLNIFHPCASMEEKIDFSFRLYDLRQTGFIEREEVKQMVIAILMESDVKLFDELLEAILDKTFAEANADKDERISREEWKAFVKRYPSLLKNTTLPCLKDVTTLFPSVVINT